MAIPRLPKGRLYRKYVIYFIVPFSATLLAIGAIGLYYFYKESRTAIVALQREKAQSAATQIEGFIRDIERQIRWIRLPPDVGCDVLERQRVEFEKLLRIFPSVSEVIWLDAVGREQIMVSRLAMNRLRGGADLFATPIFQVARSERVYFGPVDFHKGSEPFFKIAVADEHSGAGVTVVEVSLMFMSDVVRRIRVGTSGHVYVVDAGGELVSHSDVGLVLRKSDFSPLPQVRAALTSSAADAKVAEKAIDAIDHAGNRVLATHARITPLGWTVFVEQPRAEAFAPLYALVTHTMVLFALGLAMAVAASLLLARRMVTPIQVLQTGAARIGAGALDHRIEIKTGDELESLGTELSRMADNLRQSHASLEQKVVERTSELASVNQAKSRLLAAASHDLRQPLHALGLFVAALNDQGSHVERGLVKNINRSLLALEGLFNALLDISQLDAGVVEPEIRDVALMPLLDRLSTEHEPQADAKGLAWRYCSANAVVRTDAALLETVLRNLIGNAIRYTREGEVRLTCLNSNGRVRIEVADTGIGIAPEQQQEVFREFVQLHNPERDRTKGLGLGLAIVDRLTKLLDHPLHMTSAPGRGSIFTLELPCGDERAAAQAAEIGSDAPISEDPPLRVLVIEDEVDAREALVTLLKNWGHEVMAVASPDGIAAIPGPAPDAIITDYRLREDATGSDAIHRIQAIWRRTIPALIVTGDTAPERQREAQQNGFALLHKPVSPGKLRAFLRGVQRERRSRPA